MFSIKYYCTCKAGRFVGKSRLLCGYSTCRQCNIFIDCKPHGRISHTVCKLTTPLQISSANVVLSKEHLNCGFKSHLGQDFFTFLCTEVRLIICYYVWWSSRTYWLGHCCWGSSPFSAFNAGCNIIKTIVKLEAQITERNMGVHIFFKFWWFGLSTLKKQRIQVIKGVKTE